jgi:predicted transcriptional regulator
MAEREQLLQLAADIVSAHASNNTLRADQLPGLIQQVFSTLATAQQSTAPPPRPEPAVLGQGLRAPRPPRLPRLRQAFLNA